MSSRKLDGVHSLSAILQKDREDIPQAARSTQAKTKNNKFDIRAESSDEESSDSDSDSDAEPSVDFLSKINGHVSPKKAADTLVKKAKRGKDDEIADSDVERKVAATKKKAPVHPESSSEDEDSSPDADSDSESSQSENDSEIDKPAQTKNKKTEAAPKKTTSSSISESDSDSEGEVEETTKPATKPSPKRVRKAAVKDPKSAEFFANSPGESSSEEESSDREKKGAKTSEKKDSPDGEASDEEANVTAAVATKRNSNQLSVPGFVGKDFQLRQAQGDEDGKEMADFFAKAKLDGKQLWYFTAPASVPISVIENTEINMDKAKKGEPILKYNSEDYTFNFDDVDVSQSYQLLIPDKKGTRYGSASQKVDKVWHFKRVTLLGDPRANTPTIEKNAARSQPPNLRMRFRPLGITVDTPMGTIGADASSDSDEDIEMTAAPTLSSSEKPKTAPAQSQERMEIDEPATKKSKKGKKSKGTRDSEQEPQSTVIEVPNSQPMTSKKENKSKKRRDSIDSISSVGSNASIELQKSQKAAVANTKAPKRKHPSEDDQDSASAQLEKESLSAEKKIKKAKINTEVPSAKKQTAIPPPTIPKPGFTFNGLGTSPAAPAASTPKSTKSKSSKTAKETTIQPPGIRRESAVPLPPSARKQASPTTPAADKASKEQRKRRKSDKETPIPAPKPN